MEIILSVLNVEQVALLPSWQLVRSGGGTPCTLPYLPPCPVGGNARRGNERETWQRARLAGITPL